VRASGLSVQYAHRSWFEMKSRGISPTGEQLFLFSVQPDQGPGGDMVVPESALEALATAALLAMADRRPSFKHQLLALIQRGEQADR
jgi:hypothetical protein